MSRYLTKGHRNVGGVKTENRIHCKYRGYVGVCTVDDSGEAPSVFVIDPDDCMDCDVCANEYSAEALFTDEQLPPG